MSFKNSRPSINRLPLTEMLKIIDSLEWSSPPPNYKLPARDAHSGKLEGWSCCISQFQLCPATATSPLLLGYCGAFARLFRPGSGVFAHFAQPGDQAFLNPSPGLFPSFWHARGFLSEYNYTEDITGKKHVLDFMHVFLHCLWSQKYIVKLGSYRR